MVHEMEGRIGALVGAIVLLALAVPMLAPPVAAQGTLTITTYDESGFDPPGTEGFRVLAYVPVNATDSGGAVVDGGVTNDTGVLVLDLPYGTYELVFGGVNVSVWTGGSLLPGFRAMRASSSVYVDAPSKSVDLHVPLVSYPFEAGAATQCLELAFFDLDASTPTVDSLVYVPPGGKVVAKAAYWQREASGTVYWGLRVWGSWSSDPAASLDTGDCYPERQWVQEATFFVPFVEGIYGLRLNVAYGATYVPSYWTGNHSYLVADREMDLLAAGPAGPYGQGTVVVTAAAGDSPPIAEAGLDVVVIEDTVVTFDGHGSSDDVGIASYEWTFGDGYKASGVTATHAYPRSGTYLVALTVTDTLGLSDVDTLVVRVENVAPHAYGEVWETASSDTFRFVGNGTTASFDTPSDNDHLFFVWFFGDGSFAVGAVVTHTFAPGTYDVMLLVMDDDGATDVCIRHVTVPTPHDGNGGPETEPPDWTPWIFVLLLFLVFLAILILVETRRRHRPPPQRFESLAAEQGVVGAKEEAPVEKGPEGT